MGSYVFSQGVKLFLYTIGVHMWYYRGAYIDAYENQTLN